METMGKVLSAIGGIFSSGFGLVYGFKWIRKLIKVKNVIWAAIKEGKDIFDESMDITPVLKEFRDKFRLVRVGDTSKENIKRMQEALDVAFKLSKESQELFKEVKDLKQVFIDAKALF